MKLPKLLSVILIVIVLVSCKSKSMNESRIVMSDSAVSGYISSSAAIVDKKDTTRKFIRTADLKFKVASVIKSTYDIENITHQQEGFVTYTNLTSYIDRRENTAISMDSSMERTFYNVTNSITIRVPNTRLDTTLRLIARNIRFLDYRIIKADDVATDILSNELKQKRTTTSQERLDKAIENRGKKLNETVNAEELRLYKQEQNDDARIARMNLLDKVNFSTINIQLYERETVKSEIVALHKEIPEYKPGFGYRLLDSLKFGVEIVETLIVLLANLWLFAVIGLLIIVAVRFYSWRKKK